MFTDHTAFFTNYFRLLAGGKLPYPWQNALFDQMIEGDIPDSLGLPTGAGKTSIIPIWLIALAWTAISDPGARPPRRLIWVVNRRVVVDQATDEANRIVGVLNELPESDPLRSALAALSGSKRALAVSTLRGERADNREWSCNPAVPAIVIGTVDMVGSRLLFRGYGDSRYRRPLHAALLGVDSLIVNDEAHLTPAFARLLLAVRHYEPAARTGFPFRVMLVSATDRGLGSNPFDHLLEADVAADVRFQRVYEAEKRLWLEAATDAQAATRRLVTRALQDPAPRTIVFVEEPEKALEIAGQIGKAVGDGRIALLTGTMRGRERDLLAESDVFRAFGEPNVPAEPLFLVATSAAEVGVNLTSERLVTILPPADRLFQRVGRLNRFGDQDGEPHRIGEAYVVFVEPKAKDTDTPASKTLQYLRGLPAHSEGWRDISCRALRDNPAPRDACEPEPAIAPLHPWHLDLWAQTSMPNQAAPAVESWLHGKQERDIPETSLAWRAEVAVLTRDGVDPEDVRRAVECFPVRSRELLKEPARRVASKLAEIAESTPYVKALLVSSDGDVQVATVAELAEGDLAYSVVLLPPGCGGLDRGILRAAPTFDGVMDAAEEREDPPRRRFLATFTDTWQWTHVGHNDAAEPGPEPRDSRMLRRFAEEHDLGKPTVIEIPRWESEDAPPDFLVLFAPKRPDLGERREVELDDHSNAAMRHAQDLGAKLVPDHQTEWLREAARLHDQGKRHALWQRAMGGDVNHPKAKTVTARAPRLLAGFRHELHSLVLACRETSCAPVLHLVGSHHGWGRPHWEARAYDPEQPAASEAAALEAARRYGELQAEYGHWGLAYLETVFKAIDGMASEEAANA